MAKNKSVRHHFIPQFYLRSFMDEKHPPYIWVYGKEQNKIIKASVKDTAVHKHYYSFKSKDLDGANDSQTLEKWFSELEADVSKIFQKIVTKENLTNDDRSYFASFLALTLTRVPNYRENMINDPAAQLMKKLQIFMASNKKHFEAKMKQYEKDTGEKLTTSVEDLRQYILKGNYNVEVTNPDYSLGFIFDIARKTAPVFYGMKWVFFESSDEDYFLTCDNPVYYTDPTHKPDSFYGIGLMNKNLELTFPISKNLALLATWEGPTGYMNSNSKIRDTINGRTIVAARSFVFAPKQSIALHTKVKKYKGSSPKVRVG